MQLKSYQNKAIDNLERFLQLMSPAEKNSLSLAYDTLWDEKGIEGLPKYQNVIKNVGNVCFKIPTGGGKTFLACASLKKVYENLPHLSKFVVWLVPSTAILQQTLRNLQNPSHPYRMRLNADFSSDICVIDIENALYGTNFTPESVSENLTIGVMSYQSFRTSKKDGRRAYSENSELLRFQKLLLDNQHKLLKDENTAELSLINVMRCLDPVVVVDESHNTKSDLSVEMLKNLNPSFILEFTATPKKTSNIIHITPAIELKKEHMVKLPLFAYKRPDKVSVLSTAVEWRNSLEEKAKNEDNYIRPIVLFQAEPKNKDDTLTFEKIKSQLIDDLKIPENQIAIKISNKDELKNVNLMSPDCEIRYIITVNALKEGWDCPFAYILATVADKKSVVDVEQIVGRVLRLPYATQPKSSMLAKSYVFSCSDKFNDTIDKIIVGLNGAGFSERDMRAIEEIETDISENIPAVNNPAQLDIYSENEVVSHKSDIEIPQIPNNPPTVYHTNNTDSSEKIPQSSIVEKIEKTSEKIGKEYEEDVKNMSDIPPELEVNLSKVTICEEYKEIAQKLSIPKFIRPVEPVDKDDDEVFIDVLELGNSGFLTVDKDWLARGFQKEFQRMDARIDFKSVMAEAIVVDVKSDTPVTSQMTAKDNLQFKEILSSKKTNAEKLSFAIDSISNTMNREKPFGEVLQKEHIKDYLEKVFADFDDDDYAELEHNRDEYAFKVKQKIKHLIADYCEEQFYEKLETNIITCENNSTFNYTFHEMLNLKKKDTSAIVNSLYTAEGAMNDFEKKVIRKVASHRNVKFWHRIGVNANKGFFINGFINHYPDFIIYTKKGNVILLETKGDDRDNSDSIQKLKLGKTYADTAGRNYKYFMVFDTKSIDDSKTVDEFLNSLNNL